MKIKKCRSCGHEDLKLILSLGKTPLADRLLIEKQLEKPEITADLNLVFCPRCSLVQITETISPEILFDEDYPYFSSVSKTLLEHSKKNALELIKSKKLDSLYLLVPWLTQLLTYFREPDTMFQEKNVLIVQLLMIQESN